MKLDFSLRHLAHPSSDFYRGGGGAKSQNLDSIFDTTCFRVASVSRWSKIPGDLKHQCSLCVRSKIPGDLKHQCSLCVPSKIPGDLKHQCSPCVRSKIPGDLKHQCSLCVRSKIPGDLKHQCSPCVWCSANTTMKCVLR